MRCTMHMHWRAQRFVKYGNNGFDGFLVAIPSHSMCYTQYIVVRINFHPVSSVIFFSISLSLFLFTVRCDFRHRMLHRIIQRKLRHMARRQCLSLFNASAAQRLTILISNWVCLNTFFVCAVCRVQCAVCSVHCTSCIMWSEKRKDTSRQLMGNYGKPKTKTNKH